MFERTDLQQEELAQLFTSKRSQYIAFAYSYIRDHDTAEDLFMDSVAALWQKRHSLQPDSNYPALLLTILRNRCLDYLERQRKRTDIGQDLTARHERELSLRIATLHATNPERIFSTEIQDICRQTLSALPEQSRRIFNMSREQHKTNREIAEETGLSVKSVEFHITKCLKALRKALRDYVAMMLF